MKPAKASLLLHPVFLLSLITMLINDVYAKYAYSNWLTGKLSDFAGIIVLSVFLRVSWPKLSLRTVAFITAGFFIWWKSGLSQPVIYFCNSYLSIPVSRVVDYSDLLALMALPFGLLIQPRIRQLGGLRLQAIRWGLGTLTFLSLCSTTMPYRHLFQAHPQSRDIYFSESFTLKKSKAEVLATLEKKRIAYTTDSIMYYPVTNQDNLYYRVSEKDSVRWQRVAKDVDSTIFIKWEGRPYYRIPIYKVGGHTFENIRFNLRENDKKTKTTVTIQTYQKDTWRSYMVDRKIEKEYKQLFKELFQ